MRNHIASRALSLLLAILFLTGAGSLSFYLFWGGVGVYADSGTTGMSITMKEIKQNGRTVSRLSGTMRDLTLTFKVTNATNSEYNDFSVNFTSNGGFTSSGTGSRVFESTQNGKYTFTYTVTGCTYDGSADSAEFTFNNGTQTYEADLSTWRSGSGDGYSLQSYIFYDTSDRVVQRMKKGTNISMLIFTIKDNGLSKQAYDSANKSDFSAILNYATFSKNNKTLPKFSPTATLLSDGSVSYTLTFYDLRYTGATDRLELKIGYPQSFGLERRQFSETLTEGEIYVKPADPDGDGNKSSSVVEIAPPTPNLIITAYNYGGGSPTAASSVMLDVTFSNTSHQLPVENIVMKVTMPEAFTLTNSSNTFYIDRMQQGQSESRQIGFTIKPNAEAISHAIKISFSFESIIKEERKQFTSEQEISIPVSQLNRMTLNSIEVPMEIYMDEGGGGGGGFNFEATFINKGKATIYNVSASIEGENLSQPNQMQFIGNLESGKESSADFILDALVPGPLSGEVVITYEDANMNISELRTPFNTQAIKMDMGPPPDMGEGENPDGTETSGAVWYKAIPVWYWMVGVLVLLIVGAFAVKTMRSIREKKLEAQDEDF